MLWSTSNGHQEKRGMITSRRCPSMTEKRKIATAECKREAVRLVTAQRYGMAETARNLGMTVNMLHRRNRNIPLIPRPLFLATVTCRRLKQHSANSATRSSGYGWSETL